MLQLLAILTLLIPIPVWLLLIFRPSDERTRRLASEYTVFIPLGILYTFLLIGGLAAGFGLRDAVNAGLNAASGASSGDATAALTDALKTVQNALPMLALVVLAGGGIMDLAGGHYIYHDAQKQGLSTRQTGLFLALTYLTGALGFFAYILWRNLTALHRMQTLPESTGTALSATPTTG